MEDFGFFGDPALTEPFEALDYDFDAINYERERELEFEADDDFYPEDAWLDDAWADQYDDDPNPYHGDYSEM